MKQSYVKYFTAGYNDYGELIPIAVKYSINNRTGESVEQTAIDACLETDTVLFLADRGYFNLNDTLSVLHENYYIINQVVKSSSHQGIKEFIKDFNDRHSRHGCEVVATKI